MTTPAKAARDREELRLYRKIAEIDRQLKAIHDFQQTIKPWIKPEAPPSTHENNTKNNTMCASRCHPAPLSS